MGLFLQKKTQIKFEKECSCRRTNVRMNSITAQLFYKDKKTKENKTELDWIKVIFEFKNM